MLHTGVIIFALVTTSFVGGVCFTLLCLGTSVCCTSSTKKGSKEEKVKPRSLPVKRSREEDGAVAPDNPPPYAKRARQEEDMEKGAEEPKVVTVSWPLPKH